MALAPFSPTGYDLSSALARPSNGALPGRALGARFGDVVNAADYGVSWTAADNTIPLQVAVNAAVLTGKSLYLPACPLNQGYRYTPPLLIPGNLSIWSDCLIENWGAVSVEFQAINYPTGQFVSGTYNYPIQGGVLMPASNGQDAIVVSTSGNAAAAAIYGTGAGIRLDLENIGILFQAPFIGTGHGINYTPPNVTTGGNTYADNGMTGARWRNVIVYGHDGSHYAMTHTNAIYCRFDHIKSYGGGGFSILNNSAVGVYGNSLYTECTAMVMCGGAVNGWNLVSTRSSGWGRLNQITIIKPQATVQGFSAQSFAGTTPAATPTSSQYMFFSDSFTQNLVIIGNDFETTVGGKVRFPGSTGGTNACSYDLMSGVNSNLSWQAYPALVTYTAAGTLRQGGTMTVSSAGAGTVNAGGSGTITASSATAGTVAFTKAFSFVLPRVVLQGIGVTASLSSAPTMTGFAFTLSAAGGFCWDAEGV